MINQRISESLPSISLSNDISLSISNYLEIWIYCIKILQKHSFHEEQSIKDSQVI